MGQIRTLMSFFMFEVSKVSFDPISSEIQPGHWSGSS